MKIEARAKMIYQLRLDPGKSPDDVVAALTHAVWAALEQVKELGSPDPHRWPGLFDNFREAFRRRLEFYKDCGTLHECRASIGVYGGENPTGPTYILVLRGGLMSFVENLATLSWRKFRGGLERGSPPRRNLRGRFQGALHRALTPYLFYNEGCSSCRMRATVPERRVWNDPWRPR